MNLSFSYYCPWTYTIRWDDIRGVVRQLCGDEIADKTGPVWGLDEEGEIQGVCRYNGVEGMWFMMGQ